VSGFPIYGGSLISGSSILTEWFDPEYERPMVGPPVDAASIACPHCCPLSRTYHPSEDRNLPYLKYFLEVVTRVKSK
jgi:hypothetical protein